MVEIFKNNFHSNFAIDDGLCFNLALCCEINAHMNDIIAQQGQSMLGVPIKTISFYIHWTLHLNMLLKLNYIFILKV
jgi:hypothetical protein